MRYYKFTNEQEIHFGLQYHDGLNIDILPFNPSGDCRSGGIYFTNTQNILSFWGVWLREVILPEGEPIYENPGKPKKWKVHQVILSPRRKFDFKIFQELIEQGAVIRDDALRFAVGCNNYEIVNWLLEYGIKPIALDIIVARDYKRHKIVNLLETKINISENKK